MTALPRGIVGMNLRRPLAVVLVAAMTLSTVPLPAFAAQVSADNLVGYWKFDETAANSFIDASGGGLTASGSGLTGANSTPQPSNDVPSSITFTNGKSLSFDGTDDFVGISHNAALNITAAITISAWIKTSNGATGYIVSKGNDSFYLAVGANTANKAAFWLSGVSDAWLESTSNVNDGSWHLITATWDGTTKRLYVDGVQQNSVAKTGTINTGTTSMRIGRRSTDFFNGNIDDVRLYSRALAPWEIAEMGNGRHPPAYWRGRAGTGFETKRNWSGSYIPDPYSRPVLRAATGSLTLTGAVKFAGLTINSGAVLKLHGKNLTIQDNGTVTAYGTLAALNSETLSGFTLPSTKGTLLLYGTGSTTGILGGNTLNTLHLNDGLVGYWKLDETSGTRAVDNSGWGNSGSLINSPTISTSIAPTNFHNKRSLSLDGTDDYVSLGAPADLNLTTSGAMTWSFWVYSSDFSQNYKRILSRGVIGGNNQWAIALQGATSKIMLASYNGSWVESVSTTGLTSGRWNHVTVTYDTRAVRFYLNGAANGSTTHSAALPTSIVNYTYIGAESAAGGIRDFFSGRIDDIRIYNRALRLGEVAALAAGNQPSTGLATITLNNNLALKGDLILNGGTLDVSSSNYALRLSGSLLVHGGKLAARKGTITLNGNQAGLELLTGGQRLNALTLNGSSATWNTRDRLTVSGALTITTGTLDASGSYVIKAGTWTQNGGTFTPRSNTVVLTSAAASTLTPSSAFNILHVEDPTEHGLIGYWKLDEGTNTGSIIDSSGSGFHGVRRGSGSLVWTGSTLSANIAFDNPFAMHFNRSNDHVDIGRISTITDNFSVAAWLKGGGAYQLAFYNGNDTAGWGLGIGSDGTVGGLFGSVTWINSGTARPTSGWYHLALVRTSGTTQIYLNGVPTGTTYSETPNTPTAGKGAIGREPDQAPADNTYWNGQIDDVRVYNRPLSTAEVKNLANGYYANGDSGTATVTLGGNLDLSTMSIISGVVSAGTRTIDVSGDWNNYAGTGAFVAGTSTVDLDGTTTQTVRGSTNFSTFEISTAAAQTVRFSSGSVLGIATNLMLQGASSNLLTLSPLTAGYEWFLDLADDALQTVDYVSPSYSDASAGLLLLATDGTSTDGGNNTNWLFASPEVSFQSGALTLSETGGTITLHISRSGSALPIITIPYSYAGTATGTGSDYTIVTPSPLVMASGETSTGIILTLVDDATVESDETIILTLGTPTNGVVGTTGSLTITLTSDDAAASSAGASSATTSIDSTANQGGAGGGGGGGHRGNSEQMAARIRAAGQNLVARYQQRLQAGTRIAQRIDRHHLSSSSAPAVARTQRVSASSVTVAVQQSSNVSTSAAAENSVHVSSRSSVNPDARIANRRGLLLVVLGEQEILYKDVQADAWYAPYVASVIEEGVAQGYKDEAGKLKGEFGVANPVTTAEVLKMALEAAGKADDLPTLAPNNRTARATWASPYVRLGEDLDLTVLASNPDVHLGATRGEVMQILAEVMELPIGKKVSTFSDVPPEHPHTQAIAVLQFYDIVTGDTGADGKPLNTFRPDDKINRAEVAKIIALLREVLE